MNGNRRIFVVCCIAAAAMALAGASRAGERRRPAPALVTTTVRLDADGDATIEARAEMSSTRRYGQDRRRVDARRLLEDALEIGAGRRVERVVIGQDGPEQSLFISASIPELADFRRDHLEIDLPDDAAVVHSEGNLIIAVHHRREPGPGDALTTYVNKYYLPAGSVLDNYDISSGVLSFRAPGARRPGRFGPPGADNWRNLDGRWELRVSRNQPFPPGAPSLYMDLTPDGRGYGGTVVMDQRRPGTPAIVMNIQEWRQSGDRLSIKAALNMREGHRSLNVTFDFDGRMEFGSLSGRAKVTNHLSGEAPKVTDMDQLTFYHMR